MDPGAPELIDPVTRLGRLVAACLEAADADRAPAMARYMKDRFAFFGIPTPRRRAIQRVVLGSWSPDEAELVAFTDAAWSRPERELQYAACDVIARSARRCDPAFLADLERWIVTRSWWDTVDALAPSVGMLVLEYPELTASMDRWIEADDFWLARVAIIHQLRYKTATDAERLFRYCTRRAADREFFIRKGIGWALREYSKTDPNAVVAFVASHESELSPLSRREALRRIAI